MDVYYLTPTGHAYKESIPTKFRMVEFRDGYHTLSNDCIWRSGDRDDEAVVFVWQGRTSPEGGTSERVRFAMKETNRLRDHHSPVLVSRMWWRYGITGLKYAGAMLLIGFVAYAYHVYRAAGG